MDSPLASKQIFLASYLISATATETRRVTEGQPDHILHQAWRGGGSLAFIQPGASLIPRCRTPEGTHFLLMHSHLGMQRSWRFIGQRLTNGDGIQWINASVFLSPGELSWHILYKDLGTSLIFKVDKRWGIQQSQLWRWCKWDKKKTRRGKGIIVGANS